MAVTGTEAAIYEALVWYVGQFAPNLTPAFDPGRLGQPKDVAFPNVAFTPVLKKPFLAVDFFPNTSELIGIAFDSDREAQGLLQIAVVWPAGEGLVKPTQVAAQIVQAFKPGTAIVRNGVIVDLEDQPETAPALAEPNWIRIPVTIRWRASAGPNG